MSAIFSRPRLLRSGLPIALAGAAFGASAITHGGASHSLGPAPAAAAPASPNDCAGAEEDLVTVELAPQAIDGDRMTLALDAHHHFGERAAIVGAVEVIDDRGRRIGPPQDLAVRALPARARTSYRIDTAAKLADGYYRVQASVLARAGAAEDFSTHQLYFHVAGGELTPITSHDWLTQSASGLVFTTP
jgi:hypothetical protein